MGTTQQQMSPTAVSGPQTADMRASHVGDSGFVAPAVSLTAAFDGSTIVSHGPDEEATAIVQALVAIVEPLAAVIPGPVEVVVHDLSKLPDSIVALGGDPTEQGGDLTGSGVGGSAPDGLLPVDANGQVVTRVGYAGTGRDGRELHCSTIVVRGQDDRPVAALCVYHGVREWRRMAELIAGMIPVLTADTTAEGAAAPASIRDVDELADDLLRQVVHSVDVPVDLMHKRHKLAVVAGLKDRGFFILRESVDRAAAALQVSRFTIYNYLKELEAQE